MRERQSCAPPMADEIADVREIMHQRRPGAEARIYKEPRGAPQIDRRSLDLYRHSAPSPASRASATCRTTASAPTCRCATL